MIYVIILLEDIKISGYTYIVLLETILLDNIQRRNRWSEYNMIWSTSILTRMCEWPLLLCDVTRGVRWIVIYTLEKVIVKAIIFSKVICL